MTYTSFFTIFVRNREQFFFDLPAIVLFSARAIIKKKKLLLLFTTHLIPFDAREKNLTVRARRKANSLVHKEWFCCACLLHLPLYAFFLSLSLVLCQPSDFCSFFSSSSFLRPSFLFSDCFSHSLERSSKSSREFLLFLAFLTTIGRSVAHDPIH